MPIILLALLASLVACNDNPSQEVPSGTEHFPAGKWMTNLPGDPDERLAIGVRRDADGTEVVLAIGDGPALIVPAQQDGNALVLEGISLRHSSFDCSSTYYDFGRVTLRMNGDRLEIETTATWERVWSESSRSGAIAGILDGSRLEAAPEPLILGPEASFLSPLGRLATWVGQPVLLPAEATITWGAEEIPAAVENAGTFDRNIRVLPEQPLPWGADVTAHVTVVDLAGTAHQIEWTTSTEAAPTGEPDPLLVELSGYAHAGLEPLFSGLAQALLGREGGLVGNAINPWVLAFEADVPDTGSPKLEIDLHLLDRRTAEGLPVLVVVAAGTTRREEELWLEAGEIRVLPDSAGGKAVMTLSSEPIELEAFRNQRVFIAIASVAEAACLVTPRTGRETVLERVAIVP